MTDSTDHVRAAMRGDRVAFAKLYDEHARPLFLHLCGRLPRREDAEDALQATFTAVWRRLPGLRDPGRFLPWAFRIARNQATDLLRRRGPRALPLMEGEDAIGPTGHDTPETDGIRRAMTGLKPESRSIVLLRTVEGWSAERTAKAFGVTASTIRRKHARAIGQLRRALGREVSHER